MASKRKQSDQCGSSEDRSETPPRDVKKPRRMQAFKTDYSEKWPCLRPGQKGQTFGFCSVCKCDFSVAHGGKDDCRRHIESKKHAEYESKAKEVGKCLKISGFFTSSSSTKSSDNGLIEAETMLVDLVTELNLPFTACDKLTKVFKRMFKDSETAKQFQCGRSKATVIVKEMAAKESLKLADRMKSHPFTISTDGSNDAGSTKLFPLVVRTYDANSMQVRSEVLAVPACEGSATGEKIFGLIDNEFRVHNIPWDNCLAFGSDNANVMTGTNKGVYGCLLRQHPAAYLSGCVCHLIHIAAEKGAACLPLNIDQLLIDVYYYLDKSSKRQAALKDIQLYHEVKQAKILKHVSTRWLSISNCLPRLLDNWEVLYDFFKQEEKNAGGSAEVERTGRLRKLFQSRTNKLYCLFLLNVLKPFNEINTELQSEQPKIHVLKKRLEGFLRKLLVRFVKPSAMLYKLVQDVDFETKHHLKDDTELLIGQAATDFLQEAKLRDERKLEFFENARKFFQTSCKYIKTKLPISDKVLEHAQVLDPVKQMDVNFSSIEFFIQRFPKLLPDEVTTADVRLEFAQYQCTDIQQCIEDRVDTTWAKIGKLIEDGQPIFKLLPRLMLSLLAIPHSSAHCERIFSLVRKNQTESRSKLGHVTLEALLVVKSRPGDCLERTYGQKDLADFKSAYYRSLTSA